MFDLLLFEFEKETIYNPDFCIKTEFYVSFDGMPSCYSVPCRKGVPVVVAEGWVVSVPRISLLLNLN
jgi:hypothetical protein